MTSRHLHTQPMTESEAQHLSSMRYLATPVVLIPTPDPDEWLVATGFGQIRSPLGKFTTEELLSMLRRNFEGALAAHERNEARRAQLARLEAAPLDIDLSGIKLDL